jgi:hypothetical protein
MTPAAANLGLGPRAGLITFRASPLVRKTTDQLSGRLVFLREVCSLSVGQGRECKEGRWGEERQDPAKAPDGGEQQSENTSEAKPPRGSTRPADHPEQQRQTSKRGERSQDENPRHAGRGMHLIGCRSHSMDDKGDREDNAEAAYEAGKSACDLRSHPAGQSTAAGRRFSQGKRQTPGSVGRAIQPT